jgi:uncharacterized membrane protein YebE (DUF533 family)
MINAAKADGQLDAEEQQKIASKLASVGPQEVEFVRQEMARPLNMDFIADAAPGAAPQVYAASLMAINLDTEAELNYLQDLARRLDLDSQTVNQIHEGLGVRTVFV